MGNLDFIKTNTFFSLNATVKENEKTSHRVGDDLCKKYLKKDWYLNYIKNSFITQQWGHEQPIKNWVTGSEHTSHQRNYQENKHMTRCSTSLDIRKVQIKTTMRSCLMPIRVPTTNRTEQVLRGKWSPLYCGDVNGVLEINPEFPHKVKHRVTVWPGNSTPSCIPKN